jgi:hypothetical protein
MMPIGESVPRILAIKQSSLSLYLLAFGIEI